MEKMSNFYPILLTSIRLKIQDFSLYYVYFIHFIQYIMSSLSRYDAIYALDVGLELDI